MARRVGCDLSSSISLEDQCGRKPAEIAVARGWMDCAKILSPLTSPAGIYDRVFGKNDGWALKEQGDAALEENNGFALKMQGNAALESMVLKMQGDAAFEENVYADASALYTKAMEADPDNSTLYAKRCLCWVHLSEEDKALDDASTYKALEMDLSNSCYEQAAALIMMKILVHLLRWTWQSFCFVFWGVHFSLEVWPRMKPKRPETYVCNVD